MTEFNAGSYYTCIDAGTDWFTESKEYPCFSDLNDGRLYIRDDMNNRLFCDRLESKFVEVTNEQETTMNDNQRVFDLLEYVSRGVELGVDRDIIDDLLQMIRDEVRSTENEVTEPEESGLFFFDGVNITNIVREFERDMRAIERDMMANPNKVVGSPKIKAIKALRGRTGASLRDAKNFIENYKVD